MTRLTSVSDQTGSLRNLKRLVVLLVVSNIAMGIFGVYLLRAVDKRYSELLNRSVPVMNDLQGVTAQSAMAMISIGPTLFNAPAKTRADLLQRAQQAIKQDRDERTRVLANDRLPSFPEGSVALRQSGDAFTENSLAVLKLFADGKVEEAGRLRAEGVRPAFERYLEEVTKLADVLETESQRTNADYTARTSSLSTVMLGLASWPLVILGGLLILVAVLVVAMMVAFRGKDLADAP